MRRKGQIWVSATIYILIITIAIVLILAVVQPLIDRMRDKAAYTSNKDSALNLDQQISGVAAEGPGSQRVVPVDIVQGKLNLDNGTLSWQMESETKIIEPGSKKDIGRVTISSGTDVIAIQGENTTILKNKYVVVTFNNNYTTSDTVIANINLVETNANVSGINFPDIDSIGFVELEQEGTNLAFATVTAFNASGTKQLSFILRSEVDYLEITK